MKSSMNFSFLLAVFLTLAQITIISCENFEESKENHKSHLLANKKHAFSNDAPTKIFAAYRESYITKEDAKKFRNRIKNHKKPYSDKDYEDLIQEIHFKPKSKPKHPQFEKKYFDYLPADMIENAFKETKGAKNTDDSKVEFLEIEDFAKRHQALNKSRRTNSRRLRRNVNWPFSQQVVYHTPIIYHVVPHPIYQRAVVHNTISPLHSLQHTYIDWGNQPYIPPRPDRGYLPVFNGNKDKDRNPGRPVKNPLSENKPMPQPEGVDNRFEFETDNLNEVLVFENGKDSRNQRPRPRPVTTTTKRQRTTKVVPLFHNSNDYDDEEQLNRISPVLPTNGPQRGATNNQRTTTIRPTTTRPRSRTQPPLFHTVDYDDDVSPVAKNADRNRETTTRPQQFFRTTSRPTTTTVSPFLSEPQRPSQCTWAIVNCCTNVNSFTRYTCFENHGCTGFFFGVNPCSDEIVDAALDETQNFFN